MNLRNPFLSASAAIIASLCVCDMAGAQSSRPLQTDISGRWTAIGGDLVLDVSRCASGWCGVRVESDKCGMLALRLEPDQEGGAVERHGRLQLAAGSDPYFVLVDFLPETANEPLRLRIGGGTSPAFIYKRAYPYYQLFVRSGKGECLADQKSS